ncbi:hypothetical protein FOWG_13028 [Fusarium oxysporum f. sp. lycopersici MN25]|uniref:C2H2-type domain-containing protein n=1 Tax=Fusarium oxysporum f. sp. cepae TaxID=396571 RepID=A0A3L6MZA9_FUSOX|nr:hypothetical protein FOWG_13028 [Fusarium oxysporum f. sp. lycopersici MN25]RKK09554.1 hypothetical protein BFJ65_g16005 [Fusarium oxysporum f. sp. cepae]RKK44941.1 hypothetical protein BFJ66_g9281 [Fusarium oxysporum f. sp. cepae]RKK47494.1 hypothetical protein BFJ67_g7721 [Fusarium oxysporum f. sp. cepae]
MFPPSKNSRDRPIVADWMAGVQSLLPAVDFDHPNDSAEPNRHPDISAIDFAADDFNFTTDLTDDVFSNRLPLLCDDTFDDFFSFDHAANGSDNSYPISPLTEMAQSANTRADDDQRSIPRSKRANTTTTAGTQQRDAQDLRCWDHGCNGQLFTTLSNLKRHQKEKSSQRPSYPCNMCGAIFSRTTARNHHIQNQSCNRIRRHSNGRVRPNRTLRSLTQ